MGQHHQDGQRRDRQQKESALLEEDSAAFRPRQGTTQSDTRSEPLTEDVAQKDGKNRSHHDCHDVPELQLLPAVVDDQHTDKGDRRVDRSVCTDLQTTDTSLRWSGHELTL